MSDVYRRLEGCFAIVFPRLDPAEIPKVSMAAVAEWDSLATVTLVALLEEQFSIQIRLEDMVEFVSFEVIADFVEKQLTEQ